MPVEANELISSPLRVIERIFKEDGAAALEKIKDTFSSGLKKLSMIPLLGQVPLEQLQDGCLVRYRGMIQDEFDQEFFLSVFTANSSNSEEKITCCGKYRDVTDLPPGYTVDFNSPDNVHGERQTLYCVPIPGENDWVKQTECFWSGQNGDALSGDGCQSPPRSAAKRPLDDGDHDKMETDDEIDRGQAAATKKVRNEEETDRVTTQSDLTVALNHPLPGETRPPCLVKVYDTASLFPVTSMVEFIGVLSVNPSLVCFPPSADESEDILDPFASELAAEKQAHCPPPSLIPRLHCIIATPLNHVNPLLPQSLTFPVPSSVLTEVGCEVSSSRDQLLDFLTTLMLGDQLAAEYTLLHLLSRVYGRTETMALGKFSLNLMKSQPWMAASVHQFLDQLVTKSHLLPLTLLNMNSMQFSPRKDYGSNRLQAGVLQLSPGTHFLLDEMALEPGRLEEKGVKNMAALGRVVQWQKVQYDFQYYTTDFSCDLPILVFSEGRSLLNVDCRVPLQPLMASLPPEPIHLGDVSHSLSKQLRQYLTLCRELHYEVTPDIQKLLQDDFVVMRKDDPSMTGEYFHYLLALTRLVSLSHGEEVLKVSSWERARQLDRQRRTRMN